jgi:hypothetical protein
LILSGRPVLGAQIHLAMAEKFLLMSGLTVPTSWNFPLGQCYRRNTMRLLCALMILTVSLSWSPVLPRATAQLAAAPGSGSLGKPAHSQLAHGQPIAYYGDGYVLLQHGSVLHGFVKPHADRITIVLEKGKEVTLANKQVLTVGKTKESLYDYQIRGIRKWGSGEHWHLAQWCIQNQLLDQAIEHYLELEKVAADNPRFKQLDHQLKQALLADEQVRKAMTEQGLTIPELASEAKNTASSEGISEPKKWVSKAQIPVTAAGGISQATAEHPIGAASRILPGYIRRSFQTEVQNVVVSRCGQSGCHGMLAKNEFQVFQPVGEQAASISERNLESILEYIDEDAPMQSVFISYATRPHGTQRNASINTNRDEDRALLEKIMRWLQSLSAPNLESSPGSHVMAASGQELRGSQANVAPAVALIPKSAVQRANQRKSKNERDGLEAVVEDRTAKLSKPARSAPPPAILNAAELQELEDAIQQLEKLEAGGKPFRDPLDPSEFNAKYSGGASAPR